MLKDEEMHSLVITDRYRGVNLLLQAWMLLNLKRVCYSIITLVPHEALLKN